MFIFLLYIIKIHNNFFHFLEELIYLICWRYTLNETIKTDIRCAREHPPRTKNRFFGYEFKRRDYR